MYAEKNSFVVSKAEVEDSSEEVLDSSEEESDHEEDEGDLKIFIVDSNEDEDEEEDMVQYEQHSGSSEQKEPAGTYNSFSERKRHRRASDYQLEDDDLELIAENMGIDTIKAKRPRCAKFIESDDEDEEDKELKVPCQRKQAKKARNFFDSSKEDSEEDEVDKMKVETQSKIKPRKKLPITAVEKEAVEKEAVDSELDYEDNFIVDDDGRPFSGQDHENDFTDSAMRTAMDIFGNDFDPEEFRTMTCAGLLASDDDDEDEDEDEDDDDDDPEQTLEEREMRKRQSRAIKRRYQKKTTLLDMYEPSEQERGLLTDKDKVIALTDLPERFQTRACPVQEGTTAERHREAEWIYSQAFCGTTVSQQSRTSHTGCELPQKPRSCLPAIRAALEFMRRDLFEVPFIAAYRREKIEPQLTEDDLWKIWIWDEKWTQLHAKKTSLKKLFSRMQAFQYGKVKDHPDSVLSDEIRMLQDEDIERLMKVQTTDELDDVYRHFQLYYGAEVEAMQSARCPGNSQTGEKRKKPAGRRDFYSICQENGLVGLAVKFGLSAEQFGENLRDRYKTHEPEQHPVGPEQASLEYLKTTGSGQPSTVGAALHAARHIVATQLACEPEVRQAVRRAFGRRAVLHVRPTASGRRGIDEQHPCHAYRHVQNKPVGTLKDEQFLRIVQAAADGLVKYSIRVDPEGPHRSQYYEEIKGLLQRDEHSLLVETWNAQRGKALAQALVKILYPQMEKELRLTLTQEARDSVVHSYIENLRSWIEVAPFKPETKSAATHSYDDDDDESGALVLACSLPSERNGTTHFALVNAAGECVDCIKLRSFTKRRNSRIQHEIAEKNCDMECLRRYIVEKMPQVVVVGANGRETTNVIQDIQEVLRSASATASQLKSVKVELMDPNVAEVYSKSPRSAGEFPNYCEQLKLAISLGRRCVDPLLEFAALFASPFEEHQSLNVHSQQNLVSKEILLPAVERELVSRISRTGVDVNTCNKHPHWGSTLQYVCGLGPRKARYIMRTFCQERLENRTQLVTVCKMGQSVFLNCSGFLRIDTLAASDPETYIEPLDCSRIHLETYEWARKMAAEALEYNEALQDDNPSAAVAELLASSDRAERLADLDLDAFAVLMEKEGYGNKKLTFYAIREELCHPFKDRRSRSSSLSPTERFALLTGQTPASLHEGQLVTCTVTGIARRRPDKQATDRTNPQRVDGTDCWRCPFCLQSSFAAIGAAWVHIDDGTCPGQSIGAHARLASGVSGFLHIRNISDSRLGSVEERVRVGMTLRCRIIKVNLDKLSVELTSKSSHLADKDRRYASPRDPYYNAHQEEADLSQERIAAAANKKPKAAFAPVIAHPSFRHCCYAEAEKLLSTMDQGDAVIRPSSKGAGHLTVTWKVADGVYQHAGILERDKPNLFSLGRKLLVGEEEYEDLDEILVRFVNPMASNASLVLSHKYFLAADGGDFAKLSAALSQEKSKNPAKNPYFFSASKQMPGKFILSYQLSTKPEREYFQVTLEGFRFRSQPFATLDQMVRWFKTHYKERPKAAHGQQALCSGGGGARSPGPSRKHKHSHTTRSACTPAPSSLSVVSHKPFAPSSSVSCSVSAHNPPQLPRTAVFTTPQGRPSSSRTSVRPLPTYPGALQPLVHRPVPRLEGSDMRSPMRVT